MQTYMLVKFLRNRTLTFILQDQATNKISLRTVFCYLTILLINKFKTGVIILSMTEIIVIF